MLKFKNVPFFHSTMSTGHHKCTVCALIELLDEKKEELFFLDAVCFPDMLR